MFKIIFFGACVVTVAFAAEFDRFDNVIVPDTGLYKGFYTPYPYQEEQKERVVVKPLYPEVLVPAVHDVEAVGLSKLGLVATVASTAVAVVKKAFVFIITNIPALVIGSLFAFGVCKFTPICDKFHDVKSLLAVPMELKTYATPERVAQATEFVKTAIRKYRSLQNES